MFVCNTFQDNKESDRTGGKVIHTFSRVAGILTDKHVFGSSVPRPFLGVKNNKIRIANIRLKHKVS